MELGDLPNLPSLSAKYPSVAILAIMELGDLLNLTIGAVAGISSRNPRYNGIG